MVFGSMRMSASVPWTDSEQVERKCQRATCSNATGKREQEALRFAPPADKFDQQQPQAPGEMRSKQRDQRNLGRLDPRAVGPREEPVERCIARKRCPQRQEMQR